MEALRNTRGQDFRERCRDGHTGLSPVHMTWGTVGPWSSRTQVCLACSAEFYLLLRPIKPSYWQAAPHRPSLPPPSMLYIIKLADVIHTRTLLHSLHSCAQTPTFCHTQTALWVDDHGDKLQLNVRFAGLCWKTETTGFKNSTAVSRSLW